MKKFLVVFLLLFIGLVCYANWNTYETKQEAFDRRSNQNYNTYRNNNYQAPLGGYNNSMNDNGGRNYGMENYNKLNNNNNNNNYNRNNNWNRF